MSVFLLNEASKTALHIAQSYAKEYGSQEIEAPHLLNALLHRDMGIRPVLESLGKDIGYLLDWSQVMMEDLPKAGFSPSQCKNSIDVTKVLEEADEVRLKMGHYDVTPICIFIALLKPGLGFSLEKLKTFPIREREIYDVFLSGGTFDKIPSPNSSNGTSKKESSQNNQGKSALHQYCIDKLALAQEGKVDPIIGREQEVQTILEILGRKSKPNIMIIGEPGIGKTALVRGITLLIFEKKVPKFLQNATVYQLELGSLFAGASYRGEVEDRFKNIIKDLRDLSKPILFIDEINHLIDSKGIGGGVSNIIKSELSKGEITIIATSTIEEYRKGIESDLSLNRHFELLTINEPSIPIAIKMIDLLVPSYQKHHSVGISTEAIGECVRLAKRYMKDKRLPDASIDLMDRTMAAVKLANETTTLQLDKIEEEWKLLNETNFIQDYVWINTLLDKSISPILLGMYEDETDASKLESIDEINVFLTRKIKALRLFSQEKREIVGKNELAAVISLKTGIPFGKIQSQEKEKLLNMESYLNRRVVGQDHALKVLSDAILESRSGLNKAGQPIGSFFLLGPTGTGKTELCKTIADFLFNDEKAMIRFDMSEFKEEHSVSLMIGSPPGYVGYEEGGLLVNKIRKQPYSVVLFDEVEKAHPSVFDIFLQVMDEGKLTDKLGKEGDFSNALIIFTSNIGSEWIAEQFNNKKHPTSQQLMEVMAKNFRPEFLARITEIIPFKQITEEIVTSIFDIQLKSLTEPLKRQGIEFSITEEAKKNLALAGFTPKYGARQISGVIRQQLRKPISKMIIGNEVQKGQKIILSWENENPKWSIEQLSN